MAKASLLVQEMKPYGFGTYSLLLIVTVEEVQALQLSTPLLWT